MLEQITLTGNLPYTLPVGLAPNIVHRVEFTQDATGGRTVTFAGQPVVVDLAAGASSTVEFHPVLGGYVALSAQAATGVERTQYTTGAWSADAPATRPLGPDMTRVVALGSSTMHGMTQRLPQEVAGWGVTIENGCYGGERIEHALARTGIMPMKLTFPGNTIPASGAVTVTASAPNTYSMRTYRGTVGGVIGSLSMVGGGAYTWTRETPGSAVSTESGVEFIPTPVEANGTTPAVPVLRDRVTMIEIGKNSLLDTPIETINGASEAIMDWLTPMRKLVLLVGMNVGTGVDAAEEAAVLAANAYRQDRADRTSGINYADLRAYITSARVWGDTGLRPTPTDLAQQAAGRKPSSLSADSQHLNEAGYRAAVRHMLAPALAGLIGRTPTRLPKVVTSDTFTGGDAASISGRATDAKIGGTARTWTGTWAITSGNLIIPAAVGSVWLPESAMDQEVTAQLTGWAAGSTAYLVVRSLDTTDAMTNTGYRLNLRAPTPRIDKRIGGADVSLGNLSKSIGVNDVVTLRAIGTKIEALINGEVVLSVTDTDITGGNYVGIAKPDTAPGGQVQAFTVRTLEPVVSTSDSFTGDMASVVGRSTDVALGGTSRTWSGSAWATSGGALVIPTTSGGIYLPETSADQEVSAVFGAGWTGAASLCVRSASNASAMSNSGYRLNCWATTPRIDKRFGGVDTSLGNLPSGSIKPGDVMTLRARGNVIQALVNGKVVRSVVDNDIPSGTYVGIAKSSGTGGTMEHFTVRTY